MKLDTFTQLGYRAMAWLASKDELSDYVEYNKAVQITLNVLSNLPEDTQEQLLETDFLRVKDGGNQMTKEELILDYKKKFYDDKNKEWTKDSQYFCDCRTEKELRHLLSLDSKI
tara:strand:+ start:42 stop:383 length:342 start_codon:yes stop_codon:yes gene_type:complete